MNIRRPLNTILICCVSVYYFAQSEMNILMTYANDSGHMNGDHLITSKVMSQETQYNPIAKHE